MEGYRKKLGAYGEALAEKFLIRKGCRIITKNFQTRNGEIDLIAEKDRELLFVEVKTRTGNNFGWPENAVDHKKISHLYQAVISYLNDNNLRRAWRLDIISIEINKRDKTANIKWFKGIS
jgi:putative endonuclease